MFNVQILSPKLNQQQQQQRNLDEREKKRSLSTENRLHVLKALADINIGIDNDINIYTESRLEKRAS